MTLALDLTVETNKNCRVEVLDSAVDTVCTVRFDLAPGPYTAGLSTYDGLLDDKGQPTGKELSANIAFPVTIEPGGTIPVTLYGVPATLQLAPQNGGDLGGTQSTGFTLPTVVSPQQFSVTGWDADGYVIAGPGAPVPMLTTSDPYLNVEPPTSTAPNIFVLQVSGNPPAGHVASLTASLTPDAASGAAPLTSKITVTFFYAPQVSFMEYPSTQVDPWGIAAGPDGALWLTGFEDNTIARMTTAGSVTRFPIPTAKSSPWAIAAGPDGALWFTESQGNKIGRITAAGSISEYPLPAGNSFPGGIVAGPDGAMWFTNDLGKTISIGRITTGGMVTEYPTTANGFFTGAITAGPDGALWFTEGYDCRIGRITTAGTITEYPTNTFWGPAGIAAGPDGALWFTAGQDVGRITTAGIVTVYPVQDSASDGRGIVAGPDGALWFTRQDSGSDSNYVGRITTAGSITLYPQGTWFDAPEFVAVGPDGALWFTEPGAVARIGLH